MESGGAEVLAISISDTGRGIPKEDLERVFEPFFSTKRKGTGLGLSIVARIVHEHGGRIELREHHGPGAIFDVWLPRACDGDRHVALIEDGDGDGETDNVT